jgi:short-subunit dehydrogenase
MNRLCRYHAAPGDLALVTGAGSGIGRAFADRLASLGYDLALADIDGASLSTTASEIIARHGVRVEVLTIDLSEPGAARRLHDWCSSLGVTPRVVVNNAGVFSYLDIIATDPARIEMMAGLHVTSVSLISRLFGAEMAARGVNGADGTDGADGAGGTDGARSADRAGYILNMSSYASWMAWPGLAMYSATKAYIRNFSLALGAELRASGVGVTVVMPAGVTTGLYGLSPRLQRLGRRLGLLMTPERMVEKALWAMFRGRRRCVPGVVMRVLLPVVRVLPGCVVGFIRRRTLGYQK